MESLQCNPSSTQGACPRRPLLGTPAIDAADGPQRQQRSFDIEAHRGGRALRPENTLQSFANALSMGVNTLELDLGVTKDHVIVVSHERGLNPDRALGADGRYVAPPGIPFVRLTLAQVRSYDVGRIRPGSDYAARFPDQLAVPGTRIPTLAEVSRWCAGPLGTTSLCIESPRVTRTSFGRSHL